MPAERRLPDSATLRQLRRQNWTLKEIGTEYGVTEGAVWKAISKAGTGKSLKENFRDIVPWEVEPEHRTSGVMRRLHTLIRLRRNVHVTDVEKRLANEWIKTLEETGTVLAYHKDAPPNTACRKGGFYYTVRTPEDKGFIRMPEPDVIANESGN